MQERRGTLKRLSTLYGVVEEARLAEMSRRLARLDETEQAIVAQKGVIWIAREAGREALKQSYLLGWKQAGTQAAVAAWRRERLEMIREEQREQYEVAKEQYQISRMQSEQMTQLLKDANLQIGLMERRREQAVADDRYLARRCWMQMCDEASANKPGE